MSALRLLLFVKWKVLSSILFDARKNYLIRNISTGIVLAMLIYASYLFFHDLIFSYVISLEDIGYLLIDRLVSLGFLAFFFMLIISSFITALATLFRSTETEYLFSTPVIDIELFVSKYLDVVIYSSWAILFMAAPILHAYARVRNFGALEYALTGLFVLVPFIVTATAIGTVLSLLAVMISYHISIRRLILLGIALFSGFMYLIISSSQPNQLEIPFTEDFRALNIFLNNFRLNAHPFTPNFWLIQCLRSLVLHDYRGFLFYSFAQISTALFMFSALLITAKKLFFRTWILSGEQSVFRRATGGTGAHAARGLLAKPPKGQGWALFAKDAMIFLREPRQWAQILLILALLSLYLFNLRLIPGDLNNERWHTILFIMNFCFCGFILATLGVRFVFPSISLEGPSFWVLGSSPLTTAALFREKFATAFVAFILIAEPIAFISGAILKFEGLYYLFTVAGIIVMSASLSSLSVGLGAAYPDFGERNPSRIATSPGGILAIVLSLLYIGAMATLLTVPAYMHTVYLVSGGEFPGKAIAVSLILAFLLNSITIALPLKMGARSLRGRDF